MDNIDCFGNEEHPMTQDWIRDRWARLIGPLLGSAGAFSARAATGFAKESATTIESRSKPARWNNQPADSISLAELIAASAYLDFGAAEFLRFHRRLRDDDADNG